MMPWREQLRLLRKCAAWLIWPATHLWANIAYLITVSAMFVSVSHGFEWGAVACIALIVSIQVADK